MAPEGSGCCITASFVHPRDGQISGTSNPADLDKTGVLMVGHVMDLARKALHRWPAIALLPHVVCAFRRLERVDPVRELGSQGRPTLTSIWLTGLVDQL